MPETLGLAVHQLFIFRLEIYEYSLYTAKTWNKRTTCTVLSRGPGP